MNETYIGLMSGTSGDGIDAAAVSFDGGSPQLLASHCTPYSPAFRERLLAAAHGRCDSLDEVAALDAELGRLLAGAATAVAELARLAADQVRAIGSHGHTLRHRPDADPPFTVQIGDPSIIAQTTAIPTVADFRRADIALGGQAAPLAPAFHAAFLRGSGERRVVINLGGIANITVLPPHGEVLGFDSGPCNTLMDQWIGRHRQATFDAGGAWAASGRIDNTLLERMLKEPYFQQPVPKSTGRELFNLAWLDPLLADTPATPADVQATLCELSAASIAADITRHAPGTTRVLVCGGGVHNPVLIERLRAASGLPVQSTSDYGLEPDWVEAMAFAWLAQRTLAQQPGNLPSVTGASRAAILGGVYRS